MNGMLVVNKPRGMTSKDVSRRLQRICGRRLKLGHVGTLDPLADGVLPVLLGTATRLQDQLLAMKKTYRFSLAFGYETCTLDLEGSIVRTSPQTTFSVAEIEAAMAAFRGNIAQTPPLYSAVKIKGKPLYEYARSVSADNLPEIKPREVQIYDFRLLDVRPGLGFFEVTCSKGTYVRSLGRDLCNELGTCGTLTGISRVAAAGLRIEDAVLIEHIENEAALQKLLRPIDTIETDLFKLKIEDAEFATKLVQGQKLVVKPEFFATSLGGIIPSEAWLAKAGQLFLVDNLGLPFGLGKLSLLQQGMIEIRMTRGLQ